MSNGPRMGAGRGVAALVMILAAGPGPLAAEPLPSDRDGILDTFTRGRWWERSDLPAWADFRALPRDQTVAFALYTTHRGVLKLTAQLYPLLPGETRTVRLELADESGWREVARAEALEPGWAAVFRVEGWDDRRAIRYRVRHGEAAAFDGLIRRDPRDRDEIRVGLLSCNSNRNRGDRDDLVRNLAHHDPDLLAFVGDQSYDHRQHTAAFINWGRTFAAVLRDRPVVTLPDDHDVGQANLWGEGGKQADSEAGDSGGYFHPPWYVNMVQRAQGAHLPDPFDPRPIAQGITVCYTALTVGGIDFALIEDRKFKSGPKGKIPPQGPRPDHINDPNYDPAAIDVPGLQLLGERQLDFLRQWARDWRGVEMKAVISQTGFANAAHLHGPRRERLLADLDSNGWPQSGRRAAIEAMRRAFAVHLGGDQHLATVIQHGLDDWRDAIWSFVGPASFNNYYVRAWEPAEPPVRLLGRAAEVALPHRGDYRDGFGNRITMHAYANPGTAETGLADGYGLIRFHKPTRRITFECWPRTGDVAAGGARQFPGWPVSLHQYDNDLRPAVGWLPRVRAAGAERPVVEVSAEQTGEVLYTVRMAGDTFDPKVFAPGRYRLRVGSPEHDQWEEWRGLEPDDRPGTRETGPR